eukprot:3772955-Lingulodinium_polyedra.AAC.1
MAAATSSPNGIAGFLLPPGDADLRQLAENLERPIREPELTLLEIRAAGVGALARATYEPLNAR